MFSKVFCLLHVSWVFFHLKLTRWARSIKAKMSSHFNSTTDELSIFFCNIYTFCCFVFLNRVPTTTYFIQSKKLKIQPNAPIVEIIFPFNPQQSPNSQLLPIPLHNPSTCLKRQPTNPDNMSQHRGNGRA